MSITPIDLFNKSKEVISVFKTILTCVRETTGNDQVLNNIYDQMESLDDLEEKYIRQEKQKISKYKNNRIKINKFH